MTVRHFCNKCDGGMADYMGDTFTDKSGFAFDLCEKHDRQFRQWVNNVGEFSRDD